MAESQPLSMHALDEDAVLLALLEGTASETGKPFMASLVKNLALALNTYGAWVTEYLEERRTLRALAFWLDNDWLEHWEMEIDGTPCGEVIETARLVHYPENLLALYPDDPDVHGLGAVSYMGAPLLDMDGRILGHLAVLDRRPMPEQPRITTLFRIFAARAAAELRRMRAEEATKEREEKLSRLFNSAMDGIVELDSAYRITGLNAAAAKLLGGESESGPVGRDFGEMLGDADRQRLISFLRELDARPPGQQFLWVPGGLGTVRAGGREFLVEASLARFEVRRQPYYTIILRNINERLEAESRIERLTVQAEYLREEVRALGAFEEIIGESEPLLRTLHDVEQVAATDTTVLLYGETGTGKEVIARSIHAASPRADRPFIKVNCAAIPANLIESEFFGHERGAFTGATSRRDGRFALADGGTLFLDEVGELPLDVQAKLLRVLQEGEFEPVGSSHTRRVDVRLIAATNRDLASAAEKREFREDLYYRLSVFPITVPPLRERGNDVLLLASRFADRFSRRIGRPLQPMSPDMQRRLRAYSWPGNVRELQNVIERAVITSRDGRLNLDRALPEGTEAPEPEPQFRSGGSVLTARELQELERENLRRALEASGWRVSGPKGAAELLGIKPSTLASRMKALQIVRPAAAD